MTRKITGMPILVKALPYGEGGQLKQFAVIGCSTCSNSGKYAYSGPLNPQKIKKHFEDQDWVIKGEKGTCAVCVARFKAERRGESPGPKLVHVNPPQETTMSAAINAAEKTNNITLPKETPMPVAPGSTPMPVSIAKVTSLSPSHKTQLRKLMADNFDADEGRYNNGFTDATIATSVGVPINLVQDFRVVAFGELKSSAELDELDADLDKVREDVKALRSMVEEEFRVISNRIAIIAEKAADISKKMGFK